MNIGFGLDIAVSAWDNRGIRRPRSAVNARGPADYEGVDVSSMPRIVPEDDTSALESLDWDLPCGYTLHQSYGSGSAVWGVWFRSPRACGCTSPSAFKYFCNGCWTQRNSGTVYCLACFATALPMENVIRVEAL